MKDSLRVGCLQMLILRTFTVSDFLKMIKVRLVATIYPVNDGNED